MGKILSAEQSDTDILPSEDILCSGKGLRGAVRPLKNSPNQFSFAQKKTGQRSALKGNKVSFKNSFRNAECENAPFFGKKKAFPYSARSAHGDESPRDFNR